MADRRPKLLFDAVRAIDTARSFVAGVSLVDYESSILLRSAVERQMEILGEACARLLREDADLPLTVPTLRLAIGLRNRIIHGYDAVDDETVYLTVTGDLPLLRDSLSALLSSIDPGGPTP